MARGRGIIGGPKAVPRRQRRSPMSSGRLGLPRERWARDRRGQARAVVNMRQRGRNAGTPDGPDRGTQSRPPLSRAGKKVLLGASSPGQNLPCERRAREGATQRQAHVLVLSSTPPTSQVHERQVTAKSTQAQSRQQGAEKSEAGRWRTLMEDPC